MERGRGGDADRERNEHDGELRREFRPRQEQAAIIENAAARKRHAAAQLRQRFEHRVVPEIKLQEQRHVADQLDIETGQRRDQPITRQPRDADNEADNRRQHDGDGGDEKRVEKADPEGAAERRGARRISDQRLADVEAGGIVPEAEAGSDMRLRQVLHRVVDRAIGDDADDDHDGDLDGDAAEAAPSARQNLLQ